MGYSPWGHKESDMPKELSLIHTHTHTHTQYDFYLKYLSKQKMFASHLRQI